MSFSGSGARCAVSAKSVVLSPADHEISNTELAGDGPRVGQPIEDAMRRTGAADTDLPHGHAAVDAPKRATVYMGSSSGYPQQILSFPYGLDFHGQPARLIAERVTTSGSVMPERNFYAVGRLLGARCH